MDVKDKVAVVTGAASGIGKALATRFVKDGAKRVFIADINSVALQKLADEIGAVAVTTDVTKEEDVVNLVHCAEAEQGHIDLMCSNAGIFMFGFEEVENKAWEQIWQINVMAHIYAARAALPAMIAHGSGYLLNTASAAGLLSQIGSAPYSVTKHAAVGLAESLAIEHGHQGIKVSVVCPQAVNTPMILGSDGGSAGGDGVMEPEQLCDSVMAGLIAEKFMILPHPEVLTYIQGKTSNYDRWIRGMQKLRSKFL